MKKVRDHRGATLTELLVALFISFIVMGSVYNLLISQNETYVTQREVLRMQQNGRAGIDFLARSLQNVGYNLTRGQRFLAASDRYLTVVYDEDSDGVILNDEVYTYAISKPSGTATETFSITPYFDQNGDGQVSATESRTYNIPLILTGPPYHLYKITPNQSTASVEITPIAENFDYLLFRYYDQNNNPLPLNPTPPYVLSAQQRNDIRRMEIQLLARTSKRDPHYRGSGTYPNYSVATYDASGVPRNNITYNDNLHRTQFKTNVSPRNLILYTWGNLTLRCSPNPIPCPSSSAAITATLVDLFGQPKSGVAISFSSNAGTLSSTSGSTNADGEASTALSYDWTDLSKSITVSTSAIVDVDPGPDVKNKTLYNTVAAYFEAGTTATYQEDFEDAQADGWTEVSGDWKIAANNTYQINAPQANAIATLGCSSWQDYVYESKTYQIGAGQDEYFKVQTQGDTIRAKYWKDGAAEPVGWSLEVADSTFSNGNVGLRANSDNARFDEVRLYPIPQ